MTDRITKRLLSLTVVAVVALFAGLSSPAQAAQNLVGKTQVIPAFPSLKGPVSPDTTTSSMYLPSITIGYETSGAPCYNCSLSGAIAIPYPLSVIAGGSSYTITVQLQSASYVGYPLIFATVIEDGTQIGGGSVAFTSQFGAGYVGYGTFTGTLPTVPGKATIIVNVVDGASETSIAGGTVSFGIQE